MLKYHNYGYIAKLCRSKKISSSKSNKKNPKTTKIKVNENNVAINKVWKNNNENTNESLIYKVALKDENKPRP